MPDDPTPHGGEALHPPPDRARIPGAARDRPDAGTLEDLARSRPPLPEPTAPRAIDVEDEDADPVVDSGPGIADGVDVPPSVTRQPVR